MRIASPMSRPSVSVALDVHDALVTGAAMSAWRNSWKPPRPSSQVAAWPDKQHHRRFRAERGEERADRVGVAGAAGDQRDAGLAGQAAVGVGHVDGGGLVADMDEIEIGVERRVEDRHDVVAGQREHAVAAEALQRSGNDVGAAQRLGHVRPLKLTRNLAAMRRRASPPLGWRIGH